MDFSLALGGGGARGIAHLGVLKLLEEQKIKIGALSGTSIGGLVGAAYLSGNTAEELIERFSKIDQPKLYGQRKGDEPSLLGLAGGTRVLEDLLEDRTFDDLDVPFAVTAVDVEAGQMITIREGRLIDAVLATIAVPGILPARRWGGRLLVDGGVANPVPVDVAREMDPDLPVIAVVLTEEVVPGFAIPVPEIPMAAPMVDYISKMRVAQALTVFIQSIEVGSKILAEIRLERDEPEVIIRPHLGKIGLLDTVSVPRVAELGYEAAKEALPEIRNFSGLGYRIRKRFGF